MIALPQRTTSDILRNINGKHIKQTLQRLEALGILTQDIRKVILDEFNDYHRDLIVEIEGTTVDEEKQETGTSLRTAF